MPTLPHRHRPCGSCALAALLAVLLPGPVRADGEYWSVDVSPSLTSGVLSATRGALTFGANHTDYDGGVSAGLSLARTLPLELGLGGLALSAGPAIGFVFDDAGDLSTPELGMTANLQRWAGTPWGFTFLQANVNTIDRAFFLQAQIGFSEPDLYLALSRGGSTEYQEMSLTVSKGLGDTPLDLRAGYRLLEEEWFVGFSVNTF